MGSSESVGQANADKPTKMKGSKNFLEKLKGGHSHSQPPSQATEKGAPSTPQGSAFDELPQGGGQRFLEEVDCFVGLDPANLPKLDPPLNQHRGKDNLIRSVRDLHQQPPPLLPA